MSCERPVPELPQGLRLAAASPRHGELLLVDAMGEFNACQRDHGRPIGIDPEPRRAAAFDGPVVQLDDIVEIPPAADDDALPPRVLLPQQSQQSQRSLRCCIAVKVDLARPSGLPGEVTAPLKRAGAAEMSRLSHSRRARRGRAAWPRAASSYGRNSPGTMGAFPKEHAQPGEAQRLDTERQEANAWPETGGPERAWASDAAC